MSSESETGWNVSSQSAKIVLLGDSGVGKTSLVVRYARGIFSRASNPTIGASFIGKTLVVDGVKTKLQIWDTAGQGMSIEIDRARACFDFSNLPNFRFFFFAGIFFSRKERFRSLAPMYYRGARAAILVYDITSDASFVRVQEWVKELQLNARDEISMHFFSFVFAHCIYALCPVH
jgi:GTPase SAR1 family protein